MWKRKILLTASDNTNNQVKVYYNCEYCEAIEECYGKTKINICFLMASTGSFYHTKEQVILKELKKGRF